LTKKQVIVPFLFGIAVAIVIFRFLNTIAFYIPALEFIQLSSLAGLVIFIFMMLFIIYLMFRK
jgi:hypothetical protein